MLLYVRKLSAYNICRKTESVTDVGRLPSLLTNNSKVLSFRPYKYLYLWLLLAL